MYINIYIYTHRYIYIHNTHTYISLVTRTSSGLIYICIYMYMYICIYIHIYVCKYIYKFISICTCLSISLSVHSCIDIFVCMYIYTDIPSERRSSGLKPRTTTRLDSFADYRVDQGEVSAEWNSIYTHTKIYVYIYVYA